MHCIDCCNNSLTAATIFHTCAHKHSTDNKFHIKHSLSHISGEDKYIVLCIQTKIYSTLIIHHKTYWYSKHCAQIQEKLTVNSANQNFIIHQKSSHVNILFHCFNSQQFNLVSVFNGNCLDV